MSKRRTLRDRLSDAEEKVQDRSRRLQDAENAIALVLRYRLSPKAKAKLREVLRLVHVPTVSDLLDATIKDRYAATISKQLNERSQILRLFQ